MGKPRIGLGSRRERFERGLACLVEGSGAWGSRSL